MNADFSDQEKRDPETFAIIGAAMEVHRELKYGLLEAVYQDALEVEFRLRGIAFEREKLLRVRFKEQILNSYYEADFVCFGSVIVECKSLSQIGGVENAQVINYHRITGLQRAVLLNFGTPSLHYKRRVFSSKEICTNLRKSADFSL